MNKIFITTFNKKLFDAYAYKLIESYIETKQNLPLYCYVEDDINLYPQYKNVKFLNIFLEQPESKKFIQRNSQRFKDIAKKVYLLDAIRFSYKVFAQNDARKYGDHIFYLDSDTFFLKQISDDWFKECLPDNVFISCYERLGYYTETGFLAFNNIIKNANGDKISDLFFNIYTNYYIKDIIYALPAFTDCHALDAARYRFLFLKPYVTDYNNYLENKLGDKNLWLTSNELDVMKSDNFMNRYIIHNKWFKKFEK